MSQMMSQEAQDAVRKIEKLLRLAAKAGTEAEMQAATEKAQELLLKYNIDMATVEQQGGKDTKRSDDRIKGGLYHWQRELWEAVARLNWCMYWNMYVSVDKVKMVKGVDGKLVEHKRRGWQFQHRLVGRVVNILATRHMAEYLEQTIERMARDRVGSGDQYFTKWAIAFREGIASRVMEKIQDRRRQVLSEEERRAREAVAAGSKGVSTSRALTVAAYTQAEEDANKDFLYGEGWSAKKRAEVEEWAREQKKREDEYTAWAKANPEEAAAKAAKEREEEEKWWRRRPWNFGNRGETARERRQDSGGFYAGREAGESVSIDPQVGGGTKRIGR